MADTEVCRDDPELPFCKVCPDHEACSQGFPKYLVKEASDA